MGNFVKSVHELDVYRLAFEIQQEIFKLTKCFPKEELYSLTDQVRCSSRSVGANICEAWAKRRYEAHFISKLTDSDGEREETVHWVLSAYACQYISDSAKSELITRLEHLGAMINKMIECAESWCLEAKGRKQ